MLKQWGSVDMPDAMSIALALRPATVAISAPAIVALLAVAPACAVVSVFVVLRRWAYLGEGISHAGFGGVGTALLLSGAIPWLAQPVYVYLFAILFCLATALAVGWISWGSGVSGDAAIGIFVAATLAWGFVCFSIHGNSGNGGWDLWLLGDVQRITAGGALMAVGLSIAVVLIVIAFGRQIVFYSFDPILAQVSGVPAMFGHYLLILLVALVIVVSMKLAGNLLAPALLVLPGATGLAISQRLRGVMIASIISSCLAAMAGLALTVHFAHLPPGPAIVLVMFIEYIAAHLYRSFRGAGHDTM